MLSVLVLDLEVGLMNKEAQPLGLTINWAKTKIQTTDVTQYHLALQSKLVEAMWNLSIPLYILPPNFTAQVEASMNLTGAFPSPATVCRCWTGTFGVQDVSEFVVAIVVVVLLLSFRFTTVIGSTACTYFRYSGMEPRRG